MLPLKMIVLFLLFFLQWNCSEILAQEKETQYRSLDKVQFRLLYEVEKTADKDNEKIILIDTMALDIGPMWSEYYDWHKPKLDSLLKIAHKMTGLTSSLDVEDLNARLAAGAEVYNLPRSPETIRIYKKRAAQKVITVDDGPFDMVKGKPTYLYFEEEIPPMVWVISTDTATVLGYECIRASATFRGRSYNVWFTPNIPVNEGPWKFYGLPGVILRAESSDGLFQFKAIGLENVEKANIAFPNDKELVPAKDLKQLMDYQKNSKRAAEVILMYGEKALSYYTINPIKYPQIEIDR
ncbi:GLPGLI family protein [Porphyromonas cangingivalis]|uniref:GLPGLI family protein n=2 Tax=Porphyromonas cangingivalis TaxID=36874 RepID=UPI000691B948|nr:GLPGLI family protein [Porphyromonas cangingivalis]SPY35927.1 GLPGLI family protein [Porphyromonas cangingivalis]